MRSLRLSKAPTLIPRRRNRRISSQKARVQTLEELQHVAPEPAWNAIVALALGGLSPGASSGRAGITRISTSNRGIATFTAVPSGRVQGQQKGPALSLGAGWDGGGEDVAVAVWWDFENCNVPLGIEVYKVGVNIVSGLRMSGFKGPVSISAYGDTLQLSRTTQEALSSTGIQLHHIPSGGKDSTDRALLVDLILWTFEHPPPSHLFLISGDRDFSNALHRLRMMNYNILLACPAGATVSPALLGAATHVWQWNCLVRGEGLLQAHPPPDNRPPNGTPGGPGASRQSTPRPYSSPSPSAGPKGPDVNGPPLDSGGKLSLAASPPRPSPSLASVSQTSPAPPSPARSTSDFEGRTKAIAGNRVPHDVASEPDAASVPPPSKGAKSSEVKNVSLHESKSPAHLSKEILAELQAVMVSHPNGIMFTDLQTHMVNKRSVMEKDFFSTCKLVPLLSSIPDVVQLERVPMKDNKSWTYLVTPAQKTAGSKQRSSIDNAMSTKSSPVQQIQNDIHPEPSLELVGSSSNATEGGSLSVQSAVKGCQIQLDDVSQEGNRSTLQLHDTFRRDDFNASRRGAPADSSGAVDTETPTEGENLGEKETHPVDATGSRRVFLSFLSPFANIFKRRWREKAVDNESSIIKDAGHSSVNRTDEESVDPSQEKIVHTEDLSESSFPKAYEGIANGKKPESHIGKDDAAEQSSKTSVERTDEESGGFWKKWKGWFRGPSKASDPSQRDSFITNSSKFPAIFDLSDLDKVTWKELLSRPQKLMQAPGDGETDVKSTSNADTKPSSSSLTTREINVDEEECSAALWEDLKHYLRTPEGTALMSKASSRMEAVDSLRTMEPHKFRHLQRSQLLDFLEKLETGNGFDRNLSKGQFVTPADSSTEGDLKRDLVINKAETGSEGHSVGNLKPTADEQGMTSAAQNKANPHERDSPIAQPYIRSKVMDQILRGTVTSFSTPNVVSLNQNGQIRSQDNEPELSKAPSVAASLVNRSSGAISVSSNGTVSSYPSFREFQSWFLETVKESYTFCERTRKVGFDLSLVKPEFERAFKVRLDPKVYGYVRLQDLVGSISEIVVARPRHDICVVHLLKKVEDIENKQSAEASIWPQMYHDCKSLVRELMLENADGLPGAKLKPLFFSRFQYPLDHKRVGYQRMSDLLRLMPDVVSVNGKLLVPSQELLSTKLELLQDVNTRGMDIADEVNGINNTLPEIDEDFSAEKTESEPLRNWSEIDVEGNAGATSDTDLGGNDPDDKRRLQHALPSDPSASQQFSTNYQLALQPDSSPDVRSEATSASPGSPVFSVELDESATADQLESPERCESPSGAGVSPPSENVDLRVPGEAYVNVESDIDLSVDEELVNARLTPQTVLLSSKAGPANEVDGSHVDREAPNGKASLVTEEESREASDQLAELNSSSTIEDNVFGSKGVEDIISVPKKTAKERPDASHSMDLMARENSCRNAASQLQGASSDAVSTDAGHKQDKSSRVLEIEVKAKQEGEILKDSSQALENGIRGKLNCKTTKAIDADKAEDANFKEMKLSTEESITTVPEHGGDLQCNLELKASKSCDKELPRELKALPEESHRGSPTIPCVAGDVFCGVSQSSEENPERSYAAGENLDLTSQSNKVDATTGTSRMLSLSAENGREALQAEAPVQSETAQSTTCSQRQQGSCPQENIPSYDREEASADARQPADGERPSLESPSPERITHRSIWKRLFS